MGMLEWSVRELPPMENWEAKKLLPASHILFLVNYQHHTFCVVLTTRVHCSWLNVMDNVWGREWLESILKAFFVTADSLPIIPSSYIRITIIFSSTISTLTLVQAIRVMAFSHHSRFLAFYEVESWMLTLYDTSSNSILWSSNCYCRSPKQDGILSTWLIHYHMCILWSLCFGCEQRNTTQHVPAMRGMQFKSPRFLKMDESGCLGQIITHSLHFMWMTEENTFCCMLHVFQAWYFALLSDSKRHILSRCACGCMCIC